MEVMGDEWDEKEGRSLLQNLGARVEPFCVRNFENYKVISRIDTVNITQFLQ